MTDAPSSSFGAKPSKAVAWTAAAAVSTVWAILRLVVFRSVIFPLTWVLPLLLCVWTRDKGMLWTMAALYAVLHTVKQFFILPHEALPDWADWATHAATLFNITLGALVVHGIIVLRDRLEESLRRVTSQSEELARQNDRLAQQSETLAQQNEELAQQSEELAQQSQELAQQTEELAQQSDELSGHNEELQAQAEEIQNLNEELSQREGLLQALLDAVRSAGTPASAIRQICEAALGMMAAPVIGAAVYEVEGDRLVVRGSAGCDARSRQLPLARAPFLRLVLEQNRTAALDDVALRPDLGADAAIGGDLRAVLATPVRVAGSDLGILVFSCAERHEWSADQFRMAEWLAVQAGQILQTLRLRDDLARQASFIDLTPDAFMVRRADGTITLWGGGAESLYGWTKAEAIGEISHSLLRTRFAVPLQQILQQFEATGRWSGEIRHRTKDGRELVVESRWLGRRDEGGAIIEVLESNVDVTDRKQTEEALWEADRRKNEFLATLSHELRGPLAPIRYALTMLDGDPARRCEARQVIERQVAHLVRLVDDLLDVSRIASNKIRLQKRRVAVADIIERALEACRPGIQGAGHRLELAVTSTPAWVDGDPDRLSQVLTNLLINATRYTPPGGSITVSCAAIDGRVAISVRDSGIGLKKADLARVFEMFQQVDEPGHGGLGIGLSLVKQLIELHGGSVEARSDGPGQGAEFIVQLPRADAPSELAEAASGSDTEGAPVRRRILVVDDNADAAEMMKMLLQLDGHEVHAAYDAETALLRLRERRFDVGLFDIGLPGMDGYELAGHARRSGGGVDLFLVAVTGWGQAADRERARESGFDAHLTKPAEPEVLRQLLASVKARTTGGTTSAA